MERSTEEHWTWLWGYRKWLIAIALADFRNIVDGDENKAGDLADEVLLRAAQKIKTLRDRRRVKPWLRRILANAANDLWARDRSEVGSFAQWLSAVNERQADDDASRFFAFLTLLELEATKAEKRYIEAFKQDAAAKKVVNIPKNRAVQLLKKRHHAKGADLAVEQIQLADQAYESMLDVGGFAKQITANIAAIFKKTVRSADIPDDVVWEWCCALVIAEMRAGLAEVKADKSASESVAEAVDEIFRFALNSVMAAAVTNTGGSVNGQVNGWQR